MILHSRKIFLWALLFMGLRATAQPVLPSLNSATVIKRGGELYGQQMYKEAIAEYLKVPRNDTNYIDALRDITYVYYLDSNYVESLASAKKGLKFFPNRADEWYNLLANAYDEMGDQQMAIAFYDSVINRYQNAYQPWYNKGILYYDKGQLNKARECYQRALLINPFYSSAHYQLGKIAYEQGNLVPAVLSFVTNLLINPNNTYRNNVVTRLSNIAKMSDEAVKYAATKKPSAENDFELIQEIVASKLALDPKYKVKAGIDDPIVRLIQVILEKLEYDKNDQGFWMQYYTPFYTWLHLTDSYEPMMYHLFSGLEIKAVDAFVKKNKKAIDAMIPQVNKYLLNIKETQQLIADERNKQTIRYSFEDDDLVGKGKIEGTGKEAKEVGDWEFYYSNGALRSKGNLNSDGKKNGPWKFYHRNGAVRESSRWLEGKAQGQILVYYDNGVLGGEYEYEKGELQGLTTEYYFNGLVKNTCQYKAGKKNGLLTEYTSAGIKSYEGGHTNDLEEGQVIFYHKNGKPSTIYQYANGQTVGPFTSYFVNGSKKMEGTFTSDKRTGAWKEYFNSGKLKEEYLYDNNELTGACTSYYYNGNPAYKSNYEKGKLSGTYQDFGLDGKRYSSSVYDGGKLKELQFFDKQGKLVSTANVRNGGGNFVYYDEHGVKASEAFFTKEGTREGLSTWFYRNGKISTTETYKNGELEGEKISYYKNGQVSLKMNYSNGKEHGNKELFYINGQKQYAGMWQNGEPEETHLQYNELGTAEAMLNYQNGELSGFIEYYHPNGKKDYEQYYTNGWLQSVTQFDTLGGTLYHSSFANGNGAFELKKYNGKPYISIGCKAHFYNGEHTILFDDNNPSSVYYHKNGTLNGPLKNYYYGNKLSYEGNYLMGEQQGRWNFYYENGKLSYTETYDNGRLNGPVTLYNEDGTMDREITYNEGEMDSTYKMFGDDGQLQLMLNYQQGKLVSYSYNNKNGQLLPAIPIINGTGTVTAYYKNGEKSAEFGIEEGEQNGPRKLYFSNGRLMLQVTRVFGYDHGAKKIFTKEGNLYKAQNYYYDKLHGPAITYYPNGNIRAEENWYLGFLQGDSKFYDNNGKLTETRTFYFDSLQTVKK